MAVYVDTAAAQFENVNALRKYPFTEDASLVDAQNKELPLGIVTDIGMVVPADMSVSKSFKSFSPDSAPVVKLTSVHLSASMVSVCFQSVFNGKISALSVTVAASSFRPYFP